MSWFLEIVTDIGVATKQKLFHLMEKKTDESFWNLVVFGKQKHTEISKEKSSL